MIRKNVISESLIVVGVIGFVSIVVYLQAIQKDYNPLQQQMSELALGKHGSLMLIAFSCYAAAIFGLQSALRPDRPPVALKAILITSSMCMLGGGIFRLDTATDLHIVLVTLAFILLILVMVLIPMAMQRFDSPKVKSISWGAGLGTAASVALSQGVVPLGVGQRLAALSVSLWLLWFGVHLYRRKR